MKILGFINGKKEDTQLIDENKGYIITQINRLNLSDINTIIGWVLELYNGKNMPISLRLLNTYKTPQIRKPFLFDVIINHLDGNKLAKIKTLIESSIEQKVEKHTSNLESTTTTFGPHYLVNSRS